MKKQYANPTLRIVSLEDADIICTSDLGVNNEQVSGVSANSKQRGGIWGEDE